MLHVAIQNLIAKKAADFFKIKLEFRKFGREVKMRTDVSRNVRDHWNDFVNLHK